MHQGIGVKVKGESAWYASGNTFKVLTRSPGCDGADKLAIKAENSSPSMAPMRSVNAGWNLSVLATYSLIGDPEGLIYHLKSFCQLLFGNDQRWDNEQSMPVGVQEDTMIG